MKGIFLALLAGLATEATLFWVAALIAGLCMGSSQSAERALAGAFLPELRSAEPVVDLARAPRRSGRRA